MIQNIGATFILEEVLHTTLNMKASLVSAASTTMREVTLFVVCNAVPSRSRTSTPPFADSQSHVLKSTERFFGVIISVQRSPSGLFRGFQAHGNYQLCR
jgi:hypothetical protein